MAHAVLDVADRLGILADLAGAAGRTAGRVADRRGLDARATQVLLDALVEIGSVERNGSGYRAHPELPGLFGGLVGLLGAFFATVAAEVAELLAAGSRLTTARLHGAVPAPASRMRSRGRALALDPPPVSCALAGTCYRGLRVAFR